MTPNLTYVHILGFATALRLRESIYDVSCYDSTLRERLNDAR